VGSLDSVGDFNRMGNIPLVECLNDRDVTSPIDMALIITPLDEPMPSQAPVLMSASSQEPCPDSVSDLERMCVFPSAEDSGQTACPPDSSSSSLLSEPELAETFPDFWISMEGRVFVSRAPDSSLLRIVPLLLTQCPWASIHDLFAFLFG
jgi:hypothetical protein